MVTTPEIAQVLTRRSYFNTFGGNPVCTAAGHAVLKVIEKENLQENAQVVGTYLKERLNALKDKYESELFPLLAVVIYYLMIANTNMTAYTYSYWRCKGERLDAGS